VRARGVLGVLASAGYFSGSAQLPSIGHGRSSPHELDVGCRRSLVVERQPPRWV